MMAKCTAKELLETARQLIDVPRKETGGIWGRTAAVLARQAIEMRMAEILGAYEPGIRRASFTAQLLVLGYVMEDRELARQVGFVWAALSSATHYQGYELSPGERELRDWVRGVEGFVGGAGS